MDFATIQQKIYTGYGKAALRLGESYQIYRSSSAINPLDQSNLLGTILAGFNIDVNLYKNPNKFGNSLWNVMADGSQLQNYDYLVAANFIGLSGGGNLLLANGGRLIIQPSGDSSDLKTFYVSDMQPLVPIQAVECNRIVTVIRPTQPLPAGGPTGYGGYVQNDPSTFTVVMQDCPASVLQDSKGRSNPISLPTSALKAYVKVYLPFLGETFLQTGDLINTDLNVSYQIQQAELTDQGWRIIAQELGT
jgi:hypothetical protein